MERLKRLGMALAWIAVFVAVGLLLSTALYAGLAWAVPLPGGTWTLALTSLPPLLGFLGATWVIGVVLAQRSWAALGWRRDARGGFAGGFGRGVAMGAILAAAAIALAVVAGGARVSGEAASGWAARAAPLGVLLVSAALWEEVTFRGFPLRRLADAIGPWGATLLLAVGFAVAHAWNPGAGGFGLVNIGLAAVWLSVAFLSPGGIALAWGLHVGWNGGLALLFDAPVSGHAFAVPAVQYAPGGAPWLDGGAFGPEGGLVGSLALAGGTAWVLGRRAPRPASWFAA